MVGEASFRKWGITRGESEEKGDILDSGYSGDRAIPVTVAGIQG